MVLSVPSRRDSQMPIPRALRLFGLGRTGGIGGRKALLLTFLQVVFFFIGADRFFGVGSVLVRGRRIELLGHQVSRLVRHVRRRALW
jgi:hypothetical protein